MWDEDLCTLISRRVRTEQVLHAKPKTEHTRGTAAPLLFRGEGEREELRRRTKWVDLNGPGPACG